MAHPETEKVQRGVSRRELLIGGTFLGASFLASKWGVEKVAQNFSPTFDLERLKDFTILPPECPAPSELTGINLNAPFLWRTVDSPDKIEKAVNNARQFGARTIRVFINDEFEPELGKYRFEVLGKIKKLAQKFPLQVDLFDAYRLLHANKFNPVYGSPNLSSPYLVAHLDFFTDQFIRGMFLERVKTIITHLSRTPEIVAWSIANELTPPIENKKEARGILTNWYVEVVTEIRKIDPKRPILSGVTNPTLLDEERLKQCGLTANTFHLYPFSGSSENIFNVQQQKSLPLVCQEIGFPSKLFGFSFSFAHDELFSRYLSHNFSSFFEINEKEKWLKPKITSVGLWRLTFEGDSHQDGFGIDPEKSPQTLKVLQAWKEMIGKIRG